MVDFCCKEAERKNFFNFRQTNKQIQMYFRLSYDYFKFVTVKYHLMWTEVMHEFRQKQIFDLTKSWKKNSSSTSNNNKNRNELRVTTLEKDVEEKHRKQFPYLQSNRFRRILVLKMILTRLDLNVVSVIFFLRNFTNVANAHSFIFNFSKCFFSLISLEFDGIKFHRSRRYTEHGPMIKIHTVYDYIFNAKKQPIERKTNIQRYSSEVKRNTWNIAILDSLPIALCPLPPSATRYSLSSFDTLKLIFIQRVHRIWKGTKFDGIESRRHWDRSIIYG